MLLTLAQQGGFVPQIWAQEGLRLLKPMLPVTRRVARDTDYTQAFNVGDTLTVPVPGSFNAPRKSASSNVSKQSPRNLSKVTVTLNTHRTVDFAVSDITKAQANPQTMQSLMSSAIAGMSRAIEQDTIAALMGATAFSGTAGTDLTAAVVRTTVRNFNDRLIPVDGRHLVVSPKDHVALLGDSELRGYFNFIAPEALRAGELGPIFGFDTFMSQVAPATCVQRLNFVGGNNGETFRLVWNGFETADIAFNSTAATLVSNIQTALRALTDPITMGASTVSVAGAAITAIDVTFALGALNYPSALVYQTEGVAGTAYTGTCAVTNQGTVTTNNLAFHRESALFCPRMFPDIPPGQGVNAYQLTDDDPDTGTGLTLRVLQWYDGDAREYRVGFDVLYGVTLARNVGAQRVLG